MAIRLKTVTKDKKNLLGRRVIESKLSPVGGKTTSRRDVYNRNGELIKSKSVDRLGNNVTKTKSTPSMTKTVNKQMSRPTSLEKRTSKGMNNPQKFLSEKRQLATEAGKMAGSALKKQALAKEAFLRGVQKSIQPATKKK